MLVLVAALIILTVISAQAQLVTTDSFSITFTPVLIQEVVDGGHEEGDAVISPTVTFRWAYMVNTTP